MSFFRKMAETYRAVHEGRLTAQAHQMAEQFLEARLPPDVAQNGYDTVSRMADYSSVEQMAMVYVIAYANNMHHKLNMVDATEDYRTRVAQNVARACVLLARRQRSGTDFHAGWTMQLIIAAKEHGVNMDSPEISFVV